MKRQEIWVKNNDSNKWQLKNFLSFKNGKCLTVTHETPNDPVIYVWDDCRLIEPTKQAEPLIIGTRIEHEKHYTGTVCFFDEEKNEIECLMDSGYSARFNPTDVKVIGFENRNRHNAPSSKG
jgi:hypothetical protein